MVYRCVVFVFQAEDGIRDLVRSRGLGDVYKRQVKSGVNTADQNPEGKARHFPFFQIKRRFALGSAVSNLHKPSTSSNNSATSGFATTPVFGPVS